MDPLSIAASVAGLINLSTDVYKAIATYTSSVKEASVDILSLAEELSGLQSVLQRLSSFILSGSISAVSFAQSSALALALQKCGKTLSQLSTRLHHLQQDRISRVLERLRWPFSEKDTRSTMDVLRRCASTFQFSLTVEGCALLAKTSNDAARSLEIQYETATQVVQLTNAMGTVDLLAQQARETSSQIEATLGLVKEFHGQLSSPVQALTKGVTLLAYHAHEKSRAEILDWLSSPQQFQKHNDVCARRLPGTGQWLLDCELLREWLKQSNNVFCCTGGPGVGKSVLASLVVDFLRREATPKGTALAYFYFDYQEPELQTPALFVASLVRQLATQTSTFPESLVETFDHYKYENAGNLLTSLSIVLRDITDTFLRCYIVIDAFDECTEKRFRKIVLDVLNRLDQAKVRIFLTSRPHPHEIKAVYQNALRIEIKAHQDDLRAYCDSMIDSNENTSDLMDSELREEIITTVSSKADGMFLLPVLQMQVIVEAMTRSEIRKILRNLSSDLGQAFEDTMQRIQRAPLNRRQVAMSALIWVSRARKPLLVSELCHALATNIDDTEFDEDNMLPPKIIVESCFGFIIIDDESSTVRLVHYALQEYLQSREPRNVLQEEEETIITKKLLTYLCFDEPKFSRSIPSSPIRTNSNMIYGSLSPTFLEYAASNWGHHARSASAAEFETLALRFLRTPVFVARATECQTLQAGRPRTYSRGLHSPASDVDYGKGLDAGLHVAAGFGLSSLVQILIRDGFDINAANQHGNTALHEAAIKGHSDTVDMLIRNSADLNKANVDHNSPLYLAVVRSHEDLISKLLEAGADPDASCMDWLTPLHKAAENGNVSITKMLLAKGASITGASKRGMVAIHRAAGRGHLDVIGLLLEAGSPVDVITHDRWTPLHGASSSGVYRAVQMLLDHGANVNQTSQDGRTPLHRACRGAHYQTVLTLLRKNPNLLVKDGSLNIPLHRAAKGGSEKIINLLLDHDQSSVLTQLTSLNDCNRTPRDEASYSGHWSVAAQLQHHESLCVGSPTTFSSELERSVIEHDLSRLTTLLAGNVDVNEQNQDGLTPLHLALLLDAEDFAHMLLEREDTSMEIQTYTGWQPLHCAAKTGNEGLIRSCIDKGADVKARTKDGQTPLHKVCKSGNVEATRMILQSGADIDASDDFGWRPLHTAAAAGTKPIVEFLIANGADIRVRDRDDIDVQACASRRGQYDIVEYIRRQRYLADKDPRQDAAAGASLTHGHRHRH